MWWNSVWRGTEAFPWRAACVMKYWTVGKIAYAAYHCFTPNAVASHLPSAVLFSITECPEYAPEICPKLAPKRFHVIVKRIHFNFTCFFPGFKTENSKEKNPKFRKHQQVRNHFKPFRRKNSKKLFGSDSNALLAWISGALHSIPSTNQSTNQPINLSIALQELPQRRDEITESARIFQS